MNGGAAPKCLAMYLAHCRVLGNSDCTDLEQSGVEEITLDVLALLISVLH